MPAELVTHGRKELVGEIRLAARAETLIKRRGSHWHWHAFADGGLYGPAAFAGVGHPSSEFRQCRILDQSRGCQIEQPGSDDAAAAPDLRNVRQVEIASIVLGIAQRCRFCIDGSGSLAHIGGFKNREPLGIIRINSSPHCTHFMPKLQSLESIVGTATLPRNLKQSSNTKSGKIFRIIRSI